MSSGITKLTRSELVSAVILPPGRWARMRHALNRSDTWLRLGMGLLTIGVMWVATTGWKPPLPFRSGYTPPRDIIARVSFEQDDPEATQAERQRARREIVCIYENDSRPLVDLQDGLRNRVLQLVGAASYAEANRELWREFLPDGPDQQLNETQTEAAFHAFREALRDEARQKQFEVALDESFAELRQHGLLQQLEHAIGEGSQYYIKVHPVGEPAPLQQVPVQDVFTTGASDKLHNRLVEQLEFSSLAQGSAENVAQRVCTWLDRELPGAATLSLDVEATQQARDLAAASVNVVRVAYQPGMSLAPGSRSLTAKQLPLLQAEHEAALAARGAGQRLGYGLATIGMFLAVCVLCGCYMYHCERRLLRDPRHLGPLLGLAAVTVMLCRFAARDQWQAELTPLLLFGMTAAIVYRQELALLLAASVSLVVVFALGLRLTEFVVYLSAIAATIFLTGRIRTRTRLIYIGLWTGLGVMITAIGVSLLAGQPLGEAMLRCGARYAFWSVLAGLLMTGLLPFIEKLFDIQTDLSLLELGDAAHPLLQELARRAPGTYNHSINVASLAEAAAESVGANGLLVRVGAYFHDIGKMLKPMYFVENQGMAANRHESLVPAMSTLVIIAHVKDGADLARQHRLPNSIIDFIEQHHGTTLVEYFYNEAAKRSESNPHEGQIDETSFRYPGPKPQTREAGVMMLSDAVESASRTLVDPTPSRIESLVGEIAMKRLLDGQFDQCGLTLQELRTMQDCLVKSLTAVYHGRVKYPSQQQSA